MALFGFKKHKKKRAGLFIDRGYFRYLTVVGLPGSYVVTDAVSGSYLKKSLRAAILLPVTACTFIR